MSRKPLMAGNWKMFKTIAEAVELVAELKLKTGVLSDREALVCPPFTALAVVAEALKGSAIQVGAQNMNDNTQGAFTGEISPAMLKDAGATHVILGHSERRQYYGETDSLINKKSRLALDQGLIPIICVGETLAQREANQTMTVIQTQLTGGLAGFSKADYSRAVIAYEPVWAIGTGKTATPDQAQEVHAFIRSWIIKNSDQQTAENVRILYGGSVKPDNIDTLMSQRDIDGGLVGGASLKAADFLRLIQFQAG